MQNTKELLSHRRNVYSHNGEDGVLEFLISQLPASNRWAVEFGAWDGRWASNTCNLLESKNWQVVFIECDSKKFSDLTRNHGAKPGAHLVHKFIGFEGADSLDGILGSIQGCPEDPDIISMDIDGCEYHLWESMQRFRPKIIVVEYNASIPLDYEYIQPKDFSVSHSSSLRAFVNLGRRKGYTLISVLDYNLIFMEDTVLSATSLKPATPEELFAPFFDKFQTRLWQSQDGVLHLIGNNRMLWHGVTIDERKIQVLPRVLRFNPAGSGLLRATLRFIYYKIPLVPQIYNFVISGNFSVPQVPKDGESK